MSSYQIVKKIGSSSTYYYQMIRTLTGIPKDFDDLNPKYLPHNRKSNPAIEKEWQRRARGTIRGPRFLKIHGQNDSPRTWKYSLNFHGLLLYLYHESKAMRTDRRRVHSVLSNPELLKVAPFLRYWQDFEKSRFDVVEEIRKIGKEYSSQYEHEERYLMLAVATRYFFDLSYRFEYIDRMMFLSKEIKGKLKDYHLFMLDFLQSLHEREISWIEKTRVDYQSI